MKKLIADVIDKLQSEAPSEAVAGDDQLTTVKDLITDLITDNGLQSDGFIATSTKVLEFVKFIFRPKGRNYTS